MAAISRFGRGEARRWSRQFLRSCSVRRAVARGRGIVSSKVIMGLKCAFHLRLGLRLDYNIWMGTSVRLSKYTEGLGWVFK
jgi:hypothetical protein